MPTKYVNLDLRCFVAKLCTFWRTFCGPKNAVAYKKWQIWCMEVSPVFGNGMDIGEWVLSALFKQPSLVRIQWKSTEIMKQKWPSFSPTSTLSAWQDSRQDASFSHHFQGSIDFNTVNIQHTIGMYFLVFTGNRGDIGWYDLQGSYYPIHSLLPRECIGKYCPRDSISWYTPWGEYQEHILTR